MLDRNDWLCIDTGDKQQKADKNEYFHTSFFYLINFWKKIVRKKMFRGSLKVGCWLLVAGYWLLVAG